MSERNDPGLAAGQQVDNYVIERQLGGGGFSIAYLAKDLDSGQQVVLKEYMPRKLTYRGDDGLSVYSRTEETDITFARGRRLFFQEASALATIKHPNIVNVINFFRANGTVYIVMDYEKGISLQDYIKRHKGNLSEALIRTVFLPLLDGLRLLHNKGYLHLDIKPGNIFIRSGGNPLLLDFGAVHQVMQSRQDQMAQVVTPGFSPIEQSNMSGYVGPWTDLYAIGATMRACIEGKSPPEATDRRGKDPMRPAIKAFRKAYSDSLLTTMDWAMEVDPLHRPQSVDELIDVLNNKAQGRGEDGQDESMLKRFTSNLPWSRN